MAQMVTVRLCNVVIYAYHGALKEEKKLGQRFEIDVEFVYDAQAAIASDQLAESISYVQVYDLIVEIGTQHRFRLLETMAHEMGTAIKKRFSVQHGLVRIRKPSVPIPGVIDSVEVEYAF